MEKRFNPAKAAPLKETTNGSPFYNKYGTVKEKIYGFSVVYNLFTVSHICCKNANNSHIILTRKIYTILENYSQ